MTPSYTLIRSSRRTLSIQIDASGSLIVRSPMRLSIARIEEFLSAKTIWIANHQNARKQQYQLAKKLVYTKEQIQEMQQALSRYIVPRVYELWEGRGLPKITSIKVTISERRWGSCSAVNGLCFSYRLASSIESYPRFIDAIIIHELAHLREKHHQRSFWNLVYSMMPEYEDVMKNRENKI